LNLAGICNDALEAGEFLKTQPVDLLFLDINMPRLSGIGFVKSLKEPRLFVFVTAYPEYALEGFEVDAVDYLVKPVSFERFRKTVNRVLERIAKKMLKVKMVIFCYAPIKKITGLNSKIFFTSKLRAIM
jgi:two-component system, LytTR family, response regulator